MARAKVRPEPEKPRSKAARAPARGGKRAESAAADRRWRLGQLRALAHPLRLRLFELFAEAPRTTMQAAVLMGEPPTRLYHHVNALEKAGLLRLRESRPNRGTVEKYFEAVTEGMKASDGRELTAKGVVDRSVHGLAAVVFEQARRELLACLSRPQRPGAPAPIALRLVMSAPPERVAIVRKRIVALLEQIQSESRDPEHVAPERPERRARKSAAKRERWSLTVAFTPSWTQGKRG